MIYAGEEGRFMSGIYVRYHGHLSSAGKFRYEKFNRELNVHMISSGGGVLVCDGHEFHPGAGQVFVLFPGVYVSYHDHPGSPWIYDWYNIAVPADHPVWNSLRVSPSEPLLTGVDALPLLSLAAELSARFRNPPHSPLLPVRAAWDILDALSLPSPAVETDLPSRLKARVDIAGNITVKELSNEFNLDRSTLFRCFKHRFGISIKDYIEENKYLGIAEMLENSVLPVARIARLSGFSSVHYFSRAFRKRFGMSPAAWRRKRAR